MSRFAFCVTAVCLVRNRVRCRDVREWKAALDIQMVLAVAFGASRLRPAVVHADAIARGDPLHHAVEHRLSVFGLIKTEITEVVQETPRLRGDFGIDPGDVACKRIRRAGIVLRFVTQPRVPIANRGKANTVHRRILRRVTEFIDVVRHKLRAGGQQRDGVAFGVELPAGVGNDLRRIVQVSAMRQLRFGFIERRCGIRQLV